MIDNAIDQRPFGSNQDRENEKALESQYRNIAHRDIRAAVEIRRPGMHLIAKGEHKG